MFPLISYIEISELPESIERKSVFPDRPDPIIKNGNLLNDQLRRDFTINSMLISLNKKKWGKFIDLFKGIQDIKKKKN